MTESKNLIEVKDMKIHFQQKGGKVVKAVDGITFSIRKGETFGIVGESGCGEKYAWKRNTNADRIYGRESVL